MECLQYIDKINDMLSPLFFSGIESIYKDAKEASAKDPS